MAMRSSSGNGFEVFLGPAEPGQLFPCFFGYLPRDSVELVKAATTNGLVEIRQPAPDMISVVARIL
jgi:hypothetical protein